MTFLGIDVQDTLSRLRQGAESMMIDACLVTGSGPPMWNEETGMNESKPVTTYEGKCRVRLRFTQPQEQSQLGQFQTVVEAILNLPVDTSTEVREGQSVLVTACVNDPALVGTSYRIAAFTAGSLMTSRRLPLEKVLPR